MFGSTKLQNIFDMRRFFGKERRPSTIIRDNMVHTAYEEVCNEIGEYVHLVPRQFIYEKVRERTGLCLKTIAYILNHTVKQKLTIGGGVIFNILIFKKLKQFFKFLHSTGQCFLVAYARSLHVVPCYAPEPRSCASWTANRKQTRGLVEKLARIVVSISCFHVCNP